MVKGKKILAIIPARGGSQRESQKKTSLDYSMESR